MGNYSSVCKFLKGIISLSFLAIIFFCTSCSKLTYTQKKWVNWNVLFDNGTDSSSRAIIINRIKKFIIDSATTQINNDTNYNKNKQYAIDSSSIRVTFCFCDTLLYNIYGDLIVEGSGGSTETPPTNKGPKPSGGDLSSQVSDNNNVSNPKNGSTFGVSGATVSIDARSVSDSVILAIIDSGIDSTLFQQPGFSSILWQGGGPFPNERNFVEGGDSRSFFDDDQVKHGSAVAAIALESFQPLGKYPRLMILKAFDSGGNSSIYSVSCALKYAIEHNASLINASWGYYGPGDPVLQHYILAANNHEGHMIPVICAAGNDTAHHHDYTNICSDTDNTPNTILGRTRFFYPACFSLVDNNIITVTGLKDELHPCYYQNFSPEFVTLGVINSANQNRECCAFKPPYLPQNHVMEGSSFSTPVISGKIASWILDNGFRPLRDDYLRGINVQQRIPLRIYTRNGQFFQY